MHFYLALIGIFHYYLTKKHYTRGSTFAIADVCYDFTFRNKKCKMMMNLFLSKSFEPPLIIYNYSNPKEYCLSTILGQGCILGQLGISHCTGFESPKLLISLGFLYGYEMDRIIVISQLFTVTKSTKFECFMIM